MKRILTGMLLVVVVESRALGQGTILWDESVNGAFSDGTVLPTPLGMLQSGTNSIIGSTEVEPTGNTWLVHSDFFAFAVPTNAMVSSIWLQIDKPNVWTWIGDPTLSSQFAFVGNPSTGDLGPQWGLYQIMSGSYAMYMANHDTQPFISIANYRLDFFVQAIPEPASLWLLLGGLGCLGFCRWRKARLNPWHQASIGE